MFYRNEAVPRVLEHASYSAIIPSLEGNAPNWGGWNQSLLLAYRLAGQTDQAQAYAQNRKKACSEDEQYAEYYRPFLSQYIKQFGL
jgi:hypothetical protein